MDNMPCPPWILSLWQSVNTARDTVLATPTEPNRIALISLWNQYAIAVGLPLAYNHTVGDTAGGSHAHTVTPMLPIDSLLATQGATYGRAA